jgi:hypothetical protein
MGGEKRRSVFAKHHGISPVVRVNKPGNHQSRTPRMEDAMRCDLCDREETNGNLLCQTCADVIPAFALAPPLPGTELARALTAELAPYLATD